MIAAPPHGGFFIGFHWGFGLELRNKCAFLKDLFESFFGELLSSHFNERNISNLKNTLKFF